MNKQDKKLTFSTMSILGAFLILLYCFIHYHGSMLVVLGSGLIFLVSMYFFIVNLIQFSNMKNKSFNVQIKHCMDDISGQLEVINAAQTKINKANYITSRFLAQELISYTTDYHDNYEALMKNIESLLRIQTKSTKLSMKYNDSNTNKIITDIRDNRSKTIGSITNALRQLPNGDDEIMELLQEIKSHLQMQSHNSDYAIKLAQEFKNISENGQDENMEESDSFTPTFTVVNEEESIAEEETESAIDTEPSIDIEASINTTSSTEPETALPLSDDPNKQLAPDEIAALFSSLG